ncbi:MAG: exo-alpha-sialidase [Labilithrix sp.]|nr:exo-alpha-sialidase [Labilithrix sp.]
MWRGLARLLAFAIAIAVVRPEVARANGRFPASNAVIFSPSDPQTVIVRVTFGLLVTRDAGKSWRWICERGVGFSSLEDPSYVVTKSGAIVAGLFEGVRVSRDGGCTWASVPMPDGATVFVDLTERSDGALVALSSSYDKRGDGGSLYKSRLYLSTDDAKTFAPLGALMDPTLLAESVEVAPSDPSRLYVSAVRGDDSPRQGALLVSTNAGAKWTERAIPLDDKELAPFIAAVDPARPDRVYLRTSAPVERGTRLLVTDDGGKTLEKVFAAKGPLLGFALAQGGDALWIGGPDDGLHRGTREGVERASDLKVQCLAERGGVLWACSSEASGFIAGSSTDRGSTFVDRLHLAGIGGLLECPAGSNVQKECAGEFEKLRAQLGLDPVGARSASPDAGAARPDAPAPTRGLGSTGAIVVVVVVAAGAAALFVRARRR